MNPDLMTHPDSLLDLWHGLRAPRRGSPIEPRPFPPLTFTRGRSRAEVRALMAEQRLVHVRRGVLGPPPPEGARPVDAIVHQALVASRAAVERARTRAAVSHLVAAMAIGCWIFAPQLLGHLTQVTRVTTTASGDVPVRRHRAELPREDLRLAGTVMVTSPARTAVDVALTEHLVRALPVLDGLLSLGVSKEELLGRLDVFQRVPGIRGARLVVESATAKVHSVGESVVRAYVILLGLPLPETLFGIDTPRGWYELDLAWPALKVAIEIDGAVKLSGLAGETLTRALHAAAAREAALVSEGWVILHLTWQNLLDAPELCRMLVRLVRHRVI